MITFTTKVAGVKRTFTHTVSEPEPGRVLVEAGPDERTTFTVDSRGDRGLVTIHSEFDGRVLEALMNRLLAPRLLRPLYADELERLERRARGLLTATAVREVA